MKSKVVIIVFALFMGVFGLHAQQYRFAKDVESVSAINGAKIAFEKPSTGTPSPKPIPTAPQSRDAVSIIDIGTSANAYGYGYSGGQRTLIWYDEDLNVLINFHRMGGALDPDGYSGDLGYDISYDGGQTWTNMVECYVATEPSGQYYADAARYPQAVIYNPAGNTEPANAWLSFFAPNLDATNGTWGGYSYGIHKLTAVANVDTTKNLQASAGDYFQYIPDGMAISRSTGTVLVTDLNQDWASGSLNYLGDILLSRGTWSDEENDIVYEKILIEAPIVNPEYQTLPACIRVAYSPDGETAWIVILADNGNNEPVIATQKTLYPILYKSIDDGLTWSDPINVQMDGPGGIPGVLNYMTDEQWDALWLDPNPERDEVPFTTGLDFDLVVDVNGNPHIAVAVGVGYQDGTSYTLSATVFPYLALMDIYSPDGGQSWNALEIGRPENFFGTFGDLGEENRVCAATNWSGTKVFFSWLDTDDEVSNSNNSPDIWARGFDPLNFKLTANEQGEDLATNVTYGSSAMWQAYFGTMSRYIITNNDEYTLPLVYEEMTPDDPSAPVQFKYIKDFSFSDADFTVNVAPDGLMAYFTASPLSGSPGDTVQFTDLSIGNPTSWSWTFEGGQPATSTEQNTSVIYNVPGDYDVQLVVHDASNDVDTLLIENFIHISTGPHFTKVWEGNPINPMTITVNAAEINGEAMVTGDEIGVFDGENCVGVAVLEQSIDPNNNATYLYITCSKDDPDTPEIDGFIAGNDITYKMFDQSLNMESTSVSAEFPYAPNFMSETFIENETIIVELNGNSGYFEPVWSGNPLNSMNVTVSKAELDALALLPGDEVAVFDGDYCVGAEVLQQSIDPNNSNTYIYIACGQDDPDTPEIDGFTVGNTVSYRVYDRSEVFESSSITAVYPYAPAYTFTEFTINETSVVELSALSSITQTTDLISGWNLISWNVSPEEMNIQNILQPLIDNNNLVKVIDQNGDILQHMPWGWVNNIGDMCNPEGYQIKVSSNCQVITEGVPSELPMNIPLIAGFNLMGWPAQTGEDAETALADIITAGHLVKVINESGAILQHMPWGWVNNIGDLEPGEGYQVKVSSACTLVVDEPAGSGKHSKPQKKLPKILRAENESNPYNPMAFAIALNGNLPIGAEVGVFMGIRCLDAAVVEGDYLYLAAGSDDEETMEKEGFTQGERFNIRYQTEAMNKSEELPLSYLEGDEIFAPLGTFVGELKESLGVQEYAAFDAQIRPNPVKDKLYVEMQSPLNAQLKYKLWNTQGHTVLEAEKILTATQKLQIIDVSAIPAGMYLLEIEAVSEGGTEVNSFKVIKL